jgi:GNAT superfamily N-acetyltransferase
MKIKIRAATKQDGEQLAQLWMNVWQTNLKKYMPDDFLNQFSHEKQKEKYSQRAIDPEWTLLVAEDRDGIVGMVGATNSNWEIQSYPKEIKAMYIAPSYQRRGIGTLLLDSIFAELKYQRIKGAMLWCIKDNQAACSFYENCGGKRIENITPPAEYSVVPHIIYAWEF